MSYLPSVITWSCLRNSYDAKRLPKHACRIRILGRLGWEVFPGIFGRSNQKKWFTSVELSILSTLTGLPILSTVTSVLRASVCQSRSRRLAFDSVTSTRAMPWCAHWKHRFNLHVCVHTDFSLIIGGHSHPRGYDLFGPYDSPVSLVKGNAPGWWRQRGIRHPLRH